MGRNRILRRICLGALAASLAAGAALPDAAGAAWTTPPRAVTLPTGQIAHPAGGLTPLLAFPTGVAVSPDGSSVATISGNPITATANGAPTTAIQVFNAATGALEQDVQVQDAFQTIQYSPDGGTLFVAGGGSGSVLSFPLTGGLLGSPTPLPVPGCSFVSGFALTPGGSAVWAACPQEGRVVKLAAAAGTVLATVTAPGADQLAVSGSTVYATDWKGSQVWAIDAATNRVRAIPVGYEPEGIVALPDGTVLAADSGDGTLASIAPGARSATLSSLAQLPPGTDAPSMLAAGRDGRVYVTLAADNAVAVVQRAAGTWRVQGLIPAGWYPTALALSPDGGDLYAVSARGLAHSAVATTPFIDPDPVALGADGAYATVGTLQQVPLQNLSLPAHTRLARASLRPFRLRGRSPLTEGPHGPIRHIIYITRENKLYDTELGDLQPGPGTPLAVFGQTVTPNLHALARDWVNATSFYYPAYRSTSGHMWEDAGGPSDVYEREVPENYLDPSWHDPANYPAAGLLVSQALRAGLSVRTYNEELAQESGLVPAGVQAPTSVFPNYDLKIPDTQREAGWASEFSQFAAHRCTGGLATVYGSDCTLPSLEYVYLGEDHTTVYDQPGYPTIQAQVADNDLATARIIDAVSHSPYWGSTLVVVSEDDPQGTGDHVSAYRGLVGLASPWVRRGVTLNQHFDWSSAVGAIERILGLPPLSNLVEEADPLSEAFTSKPDLRPFTADPSGAQLYPFTPLPG